MHLEGSRPGSKRYKGDGYTDSGKAKDLEQLSHLALL